MNSVSATHIPRKNGALNGKEYVARWIKITIEYQATLLIAIMLIAKVMQRQTVYITNDKETE